MSGVEEKLRRALAEQARTTVTSPSAWRRIQAGIDGGGRRRRRLSVSWLLLAPATAAAIVAVVVIALAGGGENRTLQVTGQTGRLHLVPTGVEPRFRLTTATDDRSFDPMPAWAYRAYGRRGADGATVEASVVVIVPGERATSGTKLEPAPLQVLGRTVAVAGDGFGQRILSWSQADGTTVGVTTFGLTQAELLAVAESLLPVDAATAVPVLPAGFVPLGAGRQDGVPLATFQRWETDGGAWFSVMVARDPDATLDELAIWLPGSRARKVRDTTGMYLAGKESYLSWVEQPGVTVTMDAGGLTEQEVVAVAQGLRPIDDTAWAKLVAGAASKPPSAAITGPNIGPPPGVAADPNGYFNIVPVNATLPAPCPTMQVGVFLPGTVAGREVACYQVSGPFLNAGDIDTAAAREDRTTGTWAVEYTLTQRGQDRMADLFRVVGAGGQYGIVVDGRLVAVPRVDGATPTKGVVTGLDEATARKLAERLAR